MVDANPNAPRTVYRASKLDLLDPHIYADIGLGPFDVNNTVNGQIQDASS